ncbi:hypothetical protein ACKI1J_43025 [Streptomyces scabiei]|uniref:hypothetical protein n=1 Tax=Streptomyces scabiei TaxID=1930 RepID=UPI0038F7740B
MTTRRAARVVRAMKRIWARAARSRPALSGVSRAHVAELYEVDRSAVSNAIREVRPLPAARKQVFSDGQGHTLFSGVVRPGRAHDQTAVRS